VRRARGARAAPRRDRRLEGDPRARGAAVRGEELPAGPRRLRRGDDARARGARPALPPLPPRGHRLALRGGHREPRHDARRARARRAPRAAGEGATARGEGRDLGGDRGIAGRLRLAPPRVAEPEPGDAALPGGARLVGGHGGRRARARPVARDRLPHGLAGPRGGLDAELVGRPGADRRGRERDEDRRPRRGPRAGGVPVRDGRPAARQRLRGDPPRARGARERDLARARDALVRRRAVDAGAVVRERRAGDARGRRVGEPARLREGARDLPPPPLGVRQRRLALARPGLRGREAHPAPGALALGRAGVPAGLRGQLPARLAQPRARRSGALSARSRW
jgi:hypothetical protein